MDPPNISSPILKFFRHIVRRYLARHFHAVRLSSAIQFVDDGRPLIVYANHSSWWDPMISIFLAESFMPHRNHYAPMDAEALTRYGILRRVGVFPVEMKTVRGAAQLIRTGEAILRRGGVLWITPQGQFVDARCKPLIFKPGLASLATRVSDSTTSCVVLPLAIEYPFWNERLPEVLLCFGYPLEVAADETAESLQARMTDALDITMGELCNLAVRRDPGAFTTLMLGSRGVGGFYALGKHIKALAFRQPYQPEHSIRESTPMPRGGDDA